MDRATAKAAIKAAIKSLIVHACTAVGWIIGVSAVVIWYGGILAVCLWATVTACDVMSGDVHIKIPVSIEVKYDKESNHD